MVGCNNSRLKLYMGISFINENLFLCMIIINNNSSSMKNICSCIFFNSYKCQLFVSFFLVLFNIAIWTQLPNIRSWKLHKEDADHNVHLIEIFCLKRKNSIIQCSYLFYWRLRLFKNACKHNSIKYN
jgi:hypothetical protein